MAQIYPFKGFLYNQEITGDPGKVVTQPYDKTSPAMQDEYYDRSPYNVVRITLNREKRDDPETAYPDAGAAFRKWIGEKALLPQGRPAFYPYYQEYAIDGKAYLQKGFIALLDLKKSGEEIIPHEKTLAAPKQDRLHLLRSVEGNEDLIYMLYDDDALTIDRVMDKQIAGLKPVIETTDEFGATHRVWALTDPAAIEEIQRSMQSQNLFIADGHHRFETAVNYMRECEQKGWTSAGLESFDKRMVTCFNSAAGVTILATHRLLRDLRDFNAANFLQNLEEHFTVENYESAEMLWKKMREERERHVFGFYAGNKKFYLLTMKPSAQSDAAFQKHSEPWRELDVSILHTLILDRRLGIDEEKLAKQTNIDYARSREACIERVDSGKYQAAFLLNPTPPQQMQRIASTGERMPQKSTDFFPKLLTGLVFMKMQISKPPYSG
ncbi:MAG: DUF1015 domain-containing protein [Acidobacteriota bacterium]|jgi:uncharacterized protein (DUF1015 family)|nr:DUF1015 domain-containing protein [Acidobacteriota bacterium]